MFDADRSLSGTKTPMVVFDDGIKHLEFEFFSDKIEVFYLNRDSDEIYESELPFGEKLKKIIGAL